MKWNIKSLTIYNHTVYNQISIANEFNNYFSNTVQITGIKGINEKANDACPLQCSFKYFTQPFKDMNWPYTSSKETNATTHQIYPQERPGTQCIGGWVVSTPALQNLANNVI
jgi:hypothetical protein